MKTKIYRRVWPTIHYFLTKFNYFFYSISLSHLTVTVLLVLELTQLNVLKTNLDKLTIST